MLISEPLPAWLEAKHHAHCVTAREFYTLRNWHADAGEFDRADHYQARGDEYFARATAILNEFEAEPLPFADTTTPRCVYCGSPCDRPERLCVVCEQIA